MANLKPERVKRGLYRLNQWSLAARTQSAVHLIPLLAILEKGAGATKVVEFEENDDFEFWNRYFLIKKGDEKPYFNLITLRRAEAGYPRSNSATIRKNTFRLKWLAASMREEGGRTFWSLASDYGMIFRDKVLSKTGETAKVPVLDLAAVLFRNEDFPDNSTSETLLQRFHDRFKQNEQDFTALFSYQPEIPDSLFTTDPLDIPKSYDDVITAALVPEKNPLPAVQGLSEPNILAGFDDPILTQVQQILSLGTSGIVFRGPPGVGKTYYAQEIAKTLVADPINDIFRVQFHPSYGYEDFVEGYKPDDARKSGFNVVPKKFLEACKHAAQVDGYVIFIIDEINRGDPARIFGELLTFIEREYRGQTFLLPFTGEKISVPERLLLFATMNPFDRSVAQIDAAFIRRFDHIDLEPSGEVVEGMLKKGGGFTDGQIDLIVKWFETAQGLLGFGLGHAFFKHATDINKLKLIWRYRILPTAGAMLEQIDPTRTSGFVESFNALISRLEGVEAAG